MKREELSRIYFWDFQKQSGGNFLAFAHHPTTLTASLQDPEEEIITAGVQA